MKVKNILQHWKLSRYFESQSCSRCPVVINTLYNTDYTDIRCQQTKVRLLVSNSWQNKHVKAKAFLCLCRWRCYRHWDSNPHSSPMALHPSTSSPQLQDLLVEWRSANVAACLMMRTTMMLEEILIFKVVDVFLEKSCWFCGSDLCIVVMK